MLRHKPTFGKHLHRKRSCEGLVMKNKEKILPRLNRYNNLKTHTSELRGQNYSQDGAPFEVNNETNRSKMYALQRNYVTI